MSKIDWSKAPDWAGAVVNSASGNLYWVEQFGAKSRRQSLDKSEPDDDYVADMTLPEHAWQLVEVRPNIWTGEGLPPVGTVCEYYGANSDGPDGWVYIESKVIGYTDDQQFVCMQKIGCWPVVERVSNCGFRPIRTPEQIAAEERKEAIAEMASIAAVAWRASHAGEDMIVVIASALHDAGYRKQEQPK